jgi:hypothetical protein
MASTTNNRKLGLRLTVGTNSYLILDAFGGYPALTAGAYRALPEPERAARVAAFYGYLSALTGIDVAAAVLPGYEDSVLDGTACPVASYYRVEVSAVNGTAAIQDTEATSGVFEQGTSIVVKSTPATPNNAFRHWENQLGEVASNTERYAFTVQGDVALKAVYGEVTTYQVVVSSADGRGTVSGGGTVAADRTVFISSANGDDKQYAFDGWYVVGTNTLVSVPESGFYAPKPEHADAQRVIALESRYRVVLPTNPITVSLATLGTSVVLSAVALEAVASTVTIQGEYFNDALGDQRKFTLAIPRGGTHAEVTHAIPPYSISYIERIDDWTPREDDTYTYDVTHT